MANPERKIVDGCLFFYNFTLFAGSLECNMSPDGCLENISIKNLHAGLIVRFLSLPSNMPLIRYPLHSAQRNEKNVFG